MSSKIFSLLGGEGKPKDYWSPLELEIYMA
jgi:hypothetical protein